MAILILLSAIATIIYYQYWRKKNSFVSVRANLDAIKKEETQLALLTNELLQTLDSSTVAKNDDVEPKDDSNDNVYCLECFQAIDCCTCQPKPELDASCECESIESFNEIEPVQDVIKVPTESKKSPRKKRTLKQKTTEPKKISKQTKKLSNKKSTNLSSSYSK